MVLWKKLDIGHSSKVLEMASLGEEVHCMQRGAEEALGEEERSQNLGKGSAKGSEKCCDDTLEELVMVLENRRQNDL